MRIIAVLILTFLFSGLQAEEKPFIVFLNGTSSAGKSSIAFELQGKLQPSLHVGMDHYLIMMHPDYFGNGPLASEGYHFVMEEDKVIDVKIGPVGERLSYAMHRSIKALIDGGFTLIIDELLVDDQEFKDYLELFQGYQVYFIAIKPPLEVAEQREKERGDRMVGLARCGYELVYKNKIVDLEIDSSLASPKECAEQIMAFIRANPEPKAFQLNLSP